MMPVQQTPLDNQQPPQDSIVTSLIPYKNTMALLSYYFGVFGLIPFLGFPLSIAALVLGILGLRYQKRRPEAKGKGHAITGIVLGSISIIGGIIFVVLIMFA